MKEIQKDYVENLFFKEEGFIKYNHMYPISIEEEKVIIGVDRSKDTLNPNANIHGGLIFSLADTAMGLWVFINGQTGVTANASINYLKKGKGTKLIATTSCIKKGRTLSVLETKIKDEEDNLIAIATSTYYITGEIKL